MSIPPQTIIIMPSNRHSLDSKKSECDSETMAMFRMFDKDGNGQISKHELKTVLHNLGEKLSDEEIDGMIKNADVNGDGQINYIEFVAMIMKQQE